MIWEYVNPTTPTQRDSIEHKLYPGDPPKKIIPEGCELDIAMEALQDNETNRGWAIRQSRKVRGK